VNGFRGTAARALEWTGDLVSAALTRRASLDGFELGDVGELDDVRPVLEVVPPPPGPALCALPGRAEVLGEDLRHLAWRRARMYDVGRDIVQPSAAASRRPAQDRERGLGLDA
jgi:hypothetical protein